MKINKAGGSLLVLFLIIAVIMAISYSPHLLVNWEEIEENVWKKDITIIETSRTILVNDCSQDECREQIFRSCDTADEWDTVSSTPTSDKTYGFGCKSGLSIATKDWRWQWTFYGAPKKREWLRLPSVTLTGKDKQL